MHNNYIYPSRARKMTKMTGTDLFRGKPGSPDTESAEMIKKVAERLASARTKGDLGSLLAEEVTQYSAFDLQIIGGRLNKEIENLPSPYREKIKPYFCEQIFGAHHRLLLMSRSGEFKRMGSEIRDRDIFQKFCLMIPEGCFAWDDASERNPRFRHPKNRLFYYLMAALTMFVLDEPGHPAGMPFPGGFTVEKRKHAYYCLIRDKEKEVPHSICNFCPALQKEEY